MIWKSGSGRAVCERAPHERVCYPPPPPPRPRPPPPPPPPLPYPHPHPAASPTILLAMGLVHGAGQSIGVSVRADSLHFCCRIYWTRAATRAYIGPGLPLEHILDRPKQAELISHLRINVVNFVRQLLPFDPFNLKLCKCLLFLYGLWLVQKLSHKSLPTLHMRVAEQIACNTRLCCSKSGSMMI